MSGPFPSGQKFSAVDRGRQSQQRSSGRRDTGHSVRFDGATSLNSPTETLFTDGRKGIISLWYIPTAFGAQRFIVSSDATKFEIVQEGSDRLTIFAFGSAGLAYAQGSLSIFPTDGTWVHLLCSFDLTVAAPPRSELYQNDVAIGAAATLNDVDIQWSVITNIIVGGNLPNDKFFAGFVGEFWMDFTETLDLDVVDNRRRFITAEGRRVDLGPNGKRPLNKKPSIYYRSDGFVGFKTGLGVMPDLSVVRQGEITTHIGPTIRVNGSV